MRVARWCPLASKADASCPAFDGIQPSSVMSMRADIDSVDVDVDVDVDVVAAVSSPSALTRARR